MSDQTQYELIRSQTQTLLVNITENPKPTYNVDGQMFDHAGYLIKLQETIDWCDQKLVEAGAAPTESFGEGCAG